MKSKHLFFWKRKWDLRFLTRKYLNEERSGILRKENSKRELELTAFKMNSKFHTSWKEKKKLAPLIAFLVLHKVPIRYKGKYGNLESIHSFAIHENPRLYGRQMDLSFFPPIQSSTSQKSYFCFGQVASVRSVCVYESLCVCVCLYVCVKC